MSASARHSLLDQDVLLVAIVVGSFVISAISVLLHELGHAIAALWLTDEPVEIRMGRQPGTFRFGTGRLRWSLSVRGRPSPGRIGECRWITTGFPRDRMLDAAAGPLASAAVGLACSAGIVVVAEERLASTYLIPFVLGATASFVIAIGNFSAAVSPAIAERRPNSDGANFRGAALVQRIVAAAQRRTGRRLTAPEIRELLGTHHDHYRTLGVRPDFPSEAIEELRQSLTSSIEVDGGPSPGAERIAQVHHACDVLRHPTVRADYDRLRQAQRQSSPGGAGPDAPDLTAHPPSVAPPGHPLFSLVSRSEPWPPQVPGAVFVKHTRWITPPIGGAGVFVAVSADMMLIYRVRSLSLQAEAKPFTQVPLLSITGATLYDGLRSQDQVKFTAASGTYRFGDGWGDLVPAVRMQLLTLGKSVVDESARSWRVTASSADPATDWH